MTAPTRRSPNRVLALVLGVLSTVFGAASIVVGIVVDDVIGPGAALLFGLFATNVVFGVLALLAGGGLVLAAMHDVTAAKRANVIAGTAALVIGIAGLFVIGTPVNLLALNSPDTALLFVAATVHLAVGLGAVRDVDAMTAAESASPDAAAGRAD